MTTRSNLITAAAALLPVLPAAADTRCTENMMGNWRCTDHLGTPLYEVQESFIPGNWRVKPAVGSPYKPCKIRTTFTGDIVSQCW